jgi:hypothetical protein
MEMLVDMVRKAYIGGGYVQDGVGIRAPLWTMDIDRIDPKGGYVESNIRLLLHGLNFVKRDDPDDREIIAPMLHYKQSSRIKELAEEARSQGAKMPLDLVTRIMLHRGSRFDRNVYRRLTYAEELPNDPDFSKLVASVSHQTDEDVEDIDDEDDDEDDDDFLDLDLDCADLEGFISEEEDDEIEDGEETDAQPGPSSRRQEKDAVVSHAESSSPVPTRRRRSYAPAIVESEGSEAAEESEYDYYCEGANLNSYDMDDGWLVEDDVF